jgi:hypothetical protein
MIHEYALEPETVASWYEQKLFGLFVQQFGFDAGRVVARYPKKWRKLVWEAFEAAFGAAATEKDKTRMAELLKQLTSPEIVRPGHIWDPANDWLSNAETEHARKPFHAIVASKNPRSNAIAICLDDILSGTPTTWHNSNSTTVLRTAEAMANCIAPMLRCAKKILFIDPHFRASKTKFCNPLAHFLSEISLGDPTIVVEFHTGHTTDDAPNWDYFRKECEDHLPSIIPIGLTLTIRRWKNRDGGERLHNRYILTDIGGVQFGVGLDEGDRGTSDDVTRLSADTYRRRMEDYSGPAYAFDVDGKISVKGRAGQ